MKVAIAPGVWRDDGPQVAVAHISYTSVGGSPVGSMIAPPSSSALPVTAAETARRARKAEHRRKVAVPRPVCGAVMPVKETTCARTPGHRDSHLSRAAMDADLVTRRTTRVAA